MRWIVPITVLILASATAPGPAIGRTPARLPNGEDRSGAPDFNGDGHADLAIGVPGDSSRAPDAGAVQVLYGSALGLRSGGNQRWTQDSAGMRDRSEPNDQFGWTIATGDFDGDGFSDLAVGIRHEGSGAPRSGAVSIIRGSAAGLSADRNQFWTQDSPGILGASERGDRFGWSLAAADFDGNGIDDLAIGVRSEDLRCGVAGTCESAGAVTVLYGSRRGLRAIGNQLWTQDTPGIHDVAEAGDRFGWSLAAGDFDGDGYADLAAAAPYEDGGHDREGVVHIIRGSAQGLTATGDQLWSQGSPGIAGTPHLRDQFGQSLAVGDLDGDRFDDLVIGVPFEDGCWICNEGVVHAIHGSHAGLTHVGSQVWSQDTPGMPGTRDVGDQFGQAVAIGDLDGDGFDDLVVGVPWEDFTRYVHEDQGAVNVIRGSARGLTATGAQLWSQDSPGIDDVAERNDHFGEAIGIADFDGDGVDDLAVSIAWESIGRVRMGAVAVIMGTPAGLRARGDRLWTRDSKDILGIGRDGDRFGWSLSTRGQHSGSQRTCFGDRGGPC